ncbi:MAG: GNAT family N-acetyltransferase, partial [Candidatus Promineifilaceae bacterium]
MSSDAFGLPREIGNGLVLRWAQPGDIEKIAEFNFQQHNDNPDGEPEVWLRDWTHSLGGGDHPLTSPDDFTVVVDESNGGKIVSSAVLISQTWSYDGIEFGCGQLELIATEAAYRRRGLVREQMAVLHAKSEARGDLIQAITGIPWYYRQFGYEMAVNLSGRRVLPWEKVTDLPDGRAEKYIMRPAQEDDIPNLLSLYNKNCSTSLIKCQRDERIMRHELNRPLSFGFAARNRTIVETGGGDIAGYFEFITSPQGIRIRELAVIDGASLREVCWFAVRKIREQHKAKVNTSQGISFALGESHPVYDALEPELGKLVKPYAWYIRVPDLTRWLLHIKPLLDERLTRSV